MKLDPRIKSLTDILTCTNVDEARKFIGYAGYYADGICLFDNLSERRYGILESVTDCDEPFTPHGATTHWRYFLPECLLKPKEKIYKPYNLVEFMDQFTIGRPVHFRRKDAKKLNHYLAFLGYWDELCEGEINTYISFGSHYFSLDVLFNEYEWQDSGSLDWNIFGVEE